MNIETISGFEKLREELLIEREKNKKLERLLKIYEKLIPKNQLKYIKPTDAETHINFIQRAFKRKKQTDKFLNLVEQFQKSTISKGLRERNNILKEIITTEEEYLRCLIYIIQYYKEPMLKKKIIKEIEVVNTFSNLDEIIAVHSSFLSKLHAVLEHFPITNFGEIFYSQIPSFCIYAKFCNTFDDCLEDIMKLTKNYKEFENTEIPGGHTIQSLYIQPIQRLPRYSLLLKELIKNTSTYHVDYNHFVLSKQKIDSILETLNDKKKKYEFAKAIARIQQFVADIDLVVIDYTNYIDETSAIVKIKKKNQMIEEKNVVIFLFSDQFLIFEKTKKPKRISLGLIPNKTSTRKVHFDKLNDTHIVFKTYFLLTLCEVVQFKKNVIGLDCADFDSGDMYRLDIQITEAFGANRSKIWHEYFLKYIDEAEVKDGIYQIRNFSSNSTFF
eukprot:gene6927-11090_t